mmetsp:Transcript_46992/g.124408  ORF Transcript_46992/g.124408 Transcript_46992/m.124408 type:complete len:220 (+) Transcript_46992:2721-3380(+)
MSSDWSWIIPPRKHSVAVNLSWSSSVPRCPSIDRSWSPCRTSFPKPAAIWALFQAATGVFGSILATRAPRPSAMPQGWSKACRSSTTSNWKSSPSTPGLSWHVSSTGAPRSNETESEKPLTAEAMSKLPTNCVFKLTIRSPRRTSLASTLRCSSVFHAQTTEPATIASTTNVSLLKLNPQGSSSDCRTRKMLYCAGLLGPAELSVSCAALSGKFSPLIW